MISDEKRIPFTCLAIHMIFKENRIRRLVRFLAKDHVRFFGSIITFLGVAFLARGNEVGPRINTAARAWRHVIDRQIFPCAAILTFVIVALEYILPGKINALVRGVNISIQAYHGWHRVALGDRMQFVAIGGANHFTLVQEHQYKGALY